MKCTMLTSNFNEGFTHKVAAEIKKIIVGGKFAFVPSDFYANFDKTDTYFRHFCDMFSSIGIHFEQKSVVDKRISEVQAKQIISTANVIWLSGGNTYTQFQHINSYDLADTIRDFDGVVIGMSAGAINMAKTAICATTNERDEYRIYEALGLTDFTVVPHFIKEDIPQALLAHSYNYPLYGICDNAAIITVEQNTKFCGEVYLIKNGIVEKVIS